MSSKGGVGKTTSAINIAAALNQFGRQVILVDGNYTKPNVGLMLGITKLDKTLHHTLRGEENISETVYVHPSGLQVIPGSIIYEDLYQNNVKKLHEVMEFLRGKTECVIVDCGPGFSTETTDVMQILDKVILITTPDLTSITDAIKTKKFCKDKGLDILGVIVTNNQNDDFCFRISEIESIMEEKVIGNVPYDNSIKDSQHKKYPCIFTSENSKASIAYKLIAANLIGEEYVPEIEETLVDYLLKRIGFR